MKYSVLLIYALYSITANQTKDNVTTSGVQCGVQLLLQCDVDRATPPHTTKVTLFLFLVPESFSWLVPQLGSFGEKNGFNLSSLGGKESCLIMLAFFLKTKRDICFVSTKKNCNPYIVILMLWLAWVGWPLSNFTTHSKTYGELCPCLRFWVIWLVWPMDILRQKMFLLTIFISIEVYGWSGLWEIFYHTQFSCKSY